MPTHLLPLANITVPPNRLRPVLPEDVASLADSIEKLGLLQPIVVEETPDGPLLRAGEHRIAALSLLFAQGILPLFESSPLPLGFIPVVRLTDLSPLQQIEVELEENTKRRAMTWQQEAAAYARIHALLAPDAPSVKEAVRATLAFASKADPSSINSGLKEAHQTILLGQSLATNPEVAKAKTKRDAIKALSRQLRKEEDTKRLASPSLPTVILGDFRAIDLPAGPYDLLLVDPPYGIGIEQFSTQKSSEQDYDDSYEQWLPLMAALVDLSDRRLKPDSHGYVFCDSSRFAELSRLFEARGFEVYGRPLIWDRSPDGRLPTPEKWPRRCYECILYFRRGARPLFEIRSDVLSYPADRDPTNYHGAKKPVELFVDLLERSTRPGDLVLDPCGGSGTTLRACRRLGRTAVVVEKDPAYFGLIQRLVGEEKE